VILEGVRPRENREIKRKRERVMHDSIVRSASGTASVKERRRTPRGCVSPGVDQAENWRMSKVA